MKQYKKAELGAFTGKEFLRKGEGTIPSAGRSPLPGRVPPNCMRGDRMRRKALIVEDEKELAQLLGEHLRRWGFEPTILNEGKNAVAWARQNRPAVILLDLLLPDVDGYTICE